MALWRNHNIRGFITLTVMLHKFAVKNRKKKFTLLNNNEWVSIQIYRDMPFTFED